MRFGYFYGNEAEQFTFYRIPKILVTSPEFKDLSDSAKLLYGLMLDRMGLSIKNGFIDENNRAYIYFKVQDIMECMNCKSQKATKLIYELDSEHGIGLIERINHGQGKAARIYVKKFIDSEDVFNSCSEPSKTENSDFRKSKPQTFDNRKSKLSEIKNQDFRKVKCNYNNKNNTEFNNTDCNNINPINSSEAKTAIQTSGRWIDRYNKTISEIKQQIEYDILITTNDSEIVNNIVNVMADVMIVDTPYYTIENKKIPAELVRIRYRQITYGNLEAFLLEFGDVYYRIHNPKSYLITALYNIALTANTALSNRVKNDCQ